jgi:addiction module HigA family antidote
MSAGRSRTPSRRWERFQAQISEHIVLLESHLGDQGFQGATKEPVVPLGSGSHNDDQQISPGHGGCEAGVAGSLRRRAEAVGCIVKGGHRPWPLEVPCCYISVAELARQLHVPSNRINQLINGKRAMKAVTVLRLEQWLCVEAAFWMNPQNSYELDLTTDKYGEKI